MHDHRLHFRGLILDFKQEAQREMARLDRRPDKYAVLDILEDGEKCGHNRKEWKVVRCGPPPSNPHKVVAMLTYDDYIDEKIWKVVHVGPNTHK